MINNIWADCRLFFAEPVSACNIVLRKALYLATLAFVIGWLPSPPANAQTPTSIPVGKLPASAGNVGIALNPTTDMIYVANLNSNSVSVINGGYGPLAAGSNPGAVAATVNVGTSPTALAVNTMTNMIYVVNSADNTISVINGSNNTVVATVSVGVAPTAIAVNSATNMVYVVNGQTGSYYTVSVINGANNTVTATVDVGSEPDAVAVNPVTNMIYVANSSDNSVTVINGSTNAVSATVTVGADPIGITINSVTNTIYVCNNGPLQSSNNITAIDGATNTATSITVGAYTFPQDIEVNTVTNTVYVSLPGTAQIAVIDGNTNAVTSTVNLGSTGTSSPNTPGYMAVDSSTDYVYIVITGQTTSGVWNVYAMDGSTNKVAAMDPVGLVPDGIVVNPNTNTVYCANGNSNDVTVIAGQGASAPTPTPTPTPTPMPSNAPAFTTQPISATVSGGTVALYASASNNPTYQWSLNGTAISGATDSILLISNAAAAAGTYTVTATNSVGSATSSPVTLSLVETTDIGRLINISCRASVGTGANILIPGFVVGGAGTSGSESVLIRASGPALAGAPFNVPGTLADPQLELYSGSTLLATNDGWAGNASIASTAAAVGAFAWSDTASHDAALLQSLDGAYTVQISGESGDTGVVLAEVYDATPSGTYKATSPRLINISARVQVGTGANILIAGFVIGGSTSRTVLIRASGPALVPFGVTGTLPDPELQLYSGSSVLATNTGWGGESEISKTANAVGAFPWTNPSSNDSAMLITLPPGAYTAQVLGASGDSGVSLVEVYEVP